MNNEINAITGARAISEINLGIPIILSDTQNTALVMSLPMLKNKSPRGTTRLALSNERAQYLNIGSGISLLSENMSYDEILRIACSDRLSKDLLKKIKNRATTQTEIESTAVQLMRRARVIPSAVCVYNDISASEIPLLSFDIAHITRFLSRDPELDIVAQTEIHLDDIGLARLIVFKERYSHKNHIALTVNPLTSQPVVRIHSSCFFGDVLKSAKCDCGHQLNLCFDYMKHKNFILLYMDHEGRDIGLSSKTMAYALQNHGYNTLTANNIIGFADDERNFRVAAKMLESMRVKSCKLLTNNPEKLAGLSELGIQVTEQIYMPTILNKYNKRYLQTKHNMLGHYMKVKIVK